MDRVYHFIVRHMPAHLVYWAVIRAYTETTADLDAKVANVAADFKRLHHVS